MGCMFFGGSAPNPAKGLSPLEPIMGMKKGRVCRWHSALGVGAYAVGIAPQGAAAPFKKDQTLMD